MVSPLNPLEYLAKQSERAHEIDSRTAAILMCKQLEGQSPVIMQLRDVHRVHFHDVVTDLVPRRYEGAITWPSHYVCVADDTVYDPVLGSPIPKADYSLEMFGRDIKMNVYYNTDEVRRTLDSFKH